MNIIHFTDTYHPQLNGVTIAVEQAVNNLAKDNNVILFSPAYSIRSSVTKTGKLTHYKGRSLPFPIYPGVHAVLPNVVKIYRIIKKFKPDVIHIHTPFVLGVLGVLMAQIMGIKAVGTYHTLFSMGTSAYLSPKRFIPGKNIHVSSEEGIVASLVWKIQVIFFNLCNAVISPTSIIAKTIKEQGIHTKIKVLPNGVELAKFPAKKDYAHTKRVLHLGRIGYEKAIDTTVKAFAIVHKEMPEAKLVIAGDGPALKSIKQLVRSLKLTEVVEFLGMVDPVKTPEVYRSCDTFTTASPFETQGLVLVEAMLSGLPVVAAAVNAPIDIIKHGETGYLFKESNEKECAKYLLELLKKPQQIEVVGKNARKYAERFDSSKLTAELLNFYKTL